MRRVASLARDLARRELASLPAPPSLARGAAAARARRGSWNDATLDDSSAWSAPAAGDDESSTRHHLGLSSHEDPTPVTPWVRQVISGDQLLRSARYNKGMAFTDDERDKLRLRGLLPPAKFTQATQVKRVMKNVRALDSLVAKHLHLVGLQERNENLFFRVLIEHADELMPVMYSRDSVGQVCAKFSEVFNRPRGLYVSHLDRGRVYGILKNWPETKVKLVVVTDGERAMGMGDLGVQGMGVAAAKTNLYTSLGGVHPSETLAVCVDVGTNNKTLLNDPLYIGTKTERITGEVYDDLMDEFIAAVKRRFGERTVVQFEDFSNRNGKRLLDRYVSSETAFNDDIHGVAASTLAGIIAAESKTGKSASEHTYLIAGAGETGTGIGDMIAEYIATTSEPKSTVVEARRKIFFVDSKGLVTRDRAEKEPDLALHKLPYAHDGVADASTVLDAIRAVKPTALIGVRRHRRALKEGALAGKSEDGKELPSTHRVFNQDVLRTMGELNDAPLIFALSRHEGISECTAAEAYAATGGRCVFAARVNTPPFVPPPGCGSNGGKTITLQPSTSAYVFPGFAMGLILADASRVRAPLFIAAAEAVAAAVTEEELSQGAVYPRVSRMREVAASVAANVAAACYDSGLATTTAKEQAPTYEKLLETAKKRRYDPSYRSYM